MLIVFCLKAHLSHFPCFLCVWLVALFSVVIFFDPCFLLCIFYRHFLCSYIELSLNIVVYFMLITTSHWSFIKASFTISHILYIFDSRITSFYSYHLCFFLTQVLEKAIFVQLLHCCSISLPMSLLFQAGFIVLHVFVLLFSVLLFQLEELPLW